MSKPPLTALAVRQPYMAVSAHRPILCLSITRGKPAASTAYEFHYPLEMGIVLCGKMRRVFSDTETTVGPGGIWFCGMWEPHGYQIVARPCHRIVVMIYPPLLAGTQFDGLPNHHWLLPFTAAPQSRPRTTPGSARVFLDLASRLGSAMADREPWRQMRLRLLVWEALLTATRNWQPPVTTQSPLPGDFERVKTAIDAVFACHSRINTAQAARLCGLGRTRFSTVFLAVTGITFADFALRFRLSGAAQQLISSAHPLKAIAHNWGFHDESHFCRSFRHHYGQSPSQYRSVLCQHLSVPETLVT